MAGPPTKYIIDPYNHTGFAQVFKEIGDSNTVYILGHDVLAQATGSNAPKFMLYDGHGSVRHLADSAGDITESYNYDAYGNAHGFDVSSASTNLLYTGEWYDSDAAQYYLRARWYSPATGRFNRMDPFAGNNQDPQSLHKYLYAHCNPVMNVDPTGQFSLMELTARMVIGSILMEIASPVMKPAATYLAKNLLPKSWLNVFSGNRQYSAGLIGVSGTIKMPKVSFISGMGTLDLLLGVNEKSAGLYWAYGAALLAGSSITGHIGFVFNCPNSERYTGPFTSLTLPFKAVPSVIKNSIVQFYVKSFQALTPAFGPIANAIVEDFGLQASHLSKMKGALSRVPRFLDKSVITFFGAPDGGGSYGFSIGISNNPSFSIAHQWYTQLWGYPNKKASFID